MYLMKPKATRFLGSFFPSDRIFHRLLLYALVLQLMPITARSAWPATFDVRNDPLFGNATAAITSYARAKHATGTHDFCVLGNLAPDQTKSAWIIWRRMHQIVLWEGQDLASTPPRRLLNLKKDIVASEAELHGSSYLVTRQWVENLISECTKIGLHIVIRLKR